MKDNRIIMILGIAIVFIIMYLGVCLDTEIITNTERHYISMKWIEKQLLNTDYYFEFDNTTEFLLDGEFNNPSYIYHKYEIGDIIEWNTTSTYIYLKGWN